MRDERLALVALSRPVRVDVINVGEVGLKPGLELATQRLLEKAHELFPGQSDFLVNIKQSSPPLF